MNFLKTLDTSLENLNLLKHPFYKMWNEGMLTIDKLQVYATEYYHHVAAFPRYISQIHSLCDDLQSRQVLLRNLVDEEEGEENHPELWMRFMEGVGCTKVLLQPKLNGTINLVEGYFELVKADYPTGLGALYAYERQTPEVSASKIEGLSKHYGIKDQRALQFFTVHQKADEWHVEELVGLINKMSEADKQKVYAGANTGAKHLWSFLDGVYAT